MDETSETENIPNTREGVPITEGEVELLPPTYNPIVDPEEPLRVRQPPSTDKNFQMSFVGRFSPINWVFTQPPPDATVEPIFGPTTPFWNTSLA